MRILFFARCSEWMGARELELPVEGPVRVLDLVERTARLQPLLDHMDLLRVAVNHEWSDPSAEVGDDDVVAFLPPLSGG